METIIYIVIPALRCIYSIVPVLECHRLISDNVQLTPHPRFLAMVFSRRLV